MTNDEIRADRVKEALVALNTALGDAYKVGLKIEVDIFESRTMENKYPLSQISIDLFRHVQGE